MTVNIQRKIIIKKTCHVHIDREALVAAIQWYAKRPVCRVKKIFMHGRYPAVSIHEKKIHCHRLLAMWDLGRELKTSEWVHHKDENRLNCRLENLELTTDKEHGSLHNRGRKQSPIHVKRRIASTCKTRYGHENPELLNV